MCRRIAQFGILLAALAGGESTAFAQLTFNITNQGGATAQMLTGFAEAGALWSARIDDPITINIRINAAVLPAGQLGSTTAFFDPYSYASVRSAMVADRRSADDLSSTNNLQAGSTYSMLIIGRPTTRPNTFPSMAGPRPWPPSPTEEPSETDTRRITGRIISASASWTRRRATANCCRSATTIFERSTRSATTSRPCRNRRRVHCWASSGLRGSLGSRAGCASCGQASWNNFNFCNLYNSRTGP